MFKMKANRKCRSNQYFERMRKFWNTVTFLFRMKYLKSKKKKNQGMVKISNTAVKNDIVHLNAENELKMFRISRTIKENDLLLDFFQFSICCQNFSSNYSSIFHKSDFIDIVQSTFRGRDSYRRLFCFAVLINRRLNLPKPVFSVADNNFSGKRAPELRKIYITCMKDVDKYLKLLFCNYGSVNFTFGSKVLKSPVNENFVQRWNINEFFRRISLLVSLASSEQSNKRVVKTRYPLENSIFDSKSTITLGNIRDRLRLENNVNVCNQSVKHVCLEYTFEQPIQSDMKSSIIDQEKSYEMKYDTCHTVVKIEKESGAIKDINCEWNANLKRSSYYMISQANTQPECITDTTIEYSNFPITKGLTSADDSIVKKIINGKCNTTDTCLNTDSKFSISRTKDILAKTEKKRKFPTSLNLDNVKRVFNLIEPRYRLLENQYFSINSQFCSADSFKRMRTDDNQRQSVADKEASICVQKTTTGYQKSIMEVKKGQQTMNINGKQVDVNYQFRTSITGNTSDIKPRDHILIMGEREKDINNRQTFVNPQAASADHANYEFRTGINENSSDIKPHDCTLIMSECEKDINYRQTFVNHQVTSADHKKIDIDNSEENMDVIMYPSLQIIEEKEMANVQKVVKRSEERNIRIPASNYVQLVNNNNGDAENFCNSYEKNRKTVENLKILKSNQDMTMECLKTGMVDQEADRTYLTTVTNGQETIKNDEVSITNHKENSEKAILENPAKRGNNERTVVDHPDSDLDARMRGRTEPESIPECNYGKGIDDRKLNPNDYNRTAELPNPNNQGQPVIPSDQETNKLTHKRKYTRKSYMKNMEATKPERKAKLKAVLLLKRDRRVRK